LTAGEFLHLGDVWKIGTTTRGAAGRYSTNFMETLGLQGFTNGVIFVPEFAGINEAVQFAQNLNIINYQIQHNGQLPPGNTKQQ